MNKNDIRHDVDTIKEKIADRIGDAKDEIEKKLDEPSHLPWSAILIAAAALFAIALVIGAVSC